MRRLGIELLSIFDLPPVEFIQLAADMECQHISIGLSGFPMKAYGYEPWSLREDKKLKREVKAALQDTGVTISLGEGFAIRPERPITELVDDMALMAELGAPLLNTVAMDCDANRSLDQLGTLAEIAAELGLATTLEFAPGLAIDTLNKAADTVKHIAHSKLGVLVDSMHLYRSGGNAQQLAALDAGLISYAQLSDTTFTPSGPDYMREATFNRLQPGEGELPLAEFLSALPSDVIVGLETPNLERATTDKNPKRWIKECVTAARAIQPAE